nr:butyrophilin subfamily 1 member A1-like [Cavia porcellus]
MVRATKLNIDRKCVLTFAFEAEKGVPQMKVTLLRDSGRPQPMRQLFPLCPWNLPRYPALSHKEEASPLACPLLGFLSPVECRGAGPGGSCRAACGWCVTRVCSLPAWRKAQLYPDWRKELFQALSVTLDPGSAHESISISHGNSSLTCEHPGGDDLCSVLGHEGITAGRWCWELEIQSGENVEWALGVCREDANRAGWYGELVDKGFWVVEWVKTGHITSVKPNIDVKPNISEPSKACWRVGVFLDYSEGDLSFYDMTAGSHMFSFLQAPFSGTLFPYFSFKCGTVSLTICHPESGSLGHPAPFHNNCPSLKETLKSSGEGLGSGSEEGEVAPGADSPLLSRDLGAVIP